MNKETRLKVYRMYDGHCAYCGKEIAYEEMQVDHLVAKNRGLYPRWDERQGKLAITQGRDELENYMPSCRACNFRKRDMSLGQFRAEIKRQAEGLLRGAAKFQVNMSIAYGLIVPNFDKPVEFYFEKKSKHGQLDRSS